MHENLCQANDFEGADVATMEIRREDGILSGENIAYNSDKDSRNCRRS